MAGEACARAARREKRAEALKPRRGPFLEIQPVIARSKRSTGRCNATRRRQGRYDDGRRTPPVTKAAEPAETSYQGSPSGGFSSTWKRPESPNRRAEKHRGHSRPGRSVCARLIRHGASSRGLRRPIDRARYEGVATDAREAMGSLVRRVIVGGSRTAGPTNAIGRWSSSD